MVGIGKGEAGMGKGLYLLISSLNLTLTNKKSFWYTLRHFIVLYTNPFTFPLWRRCIAYSCF